MNTEYVRIDILTVDEVAAIRLAIEATRARLPKEKLPLRQKLFLVNRKLDCAMRDRENAWPGGGNN